MTETTEYVREWSRRVAACGKRTLREVREGYLRAARDKTLDEGSRRFARRRARALAVWLEKRKPPVDF